MGNKQIVIIKSREKAKDFNNNDEIKKNNHIIFKDVDSIKDNILSSGPIFLNDVLLKHPFEEGKYVKIEESEILIIKSKLNIIKELCSSLGATSIKSSVHILETKNLNKKNSVDGGSSYINVNSETEISNSKKSKYEQEIIDETEFIKPMNFSIEETYSSAKDIAEKYNLNNDPDIKSLLTLMDPQRKGSILKRQIVKFNASSEINNLFEISASLKSSPIDLGLSANFYKTIEQINTLQITLDVTF